MDGSLPQSIGGGIGQSRSETNAHGDRTRCVLEDGVSRVGLRSGMHVASALCDVGRADVGCATARLCQFMLRTAHIGEVQVAPPLSMPCCKARS
eukprot:2354804-Rhodomonas_salina.3